MCGDIGKGGANLFWAPKVPEKNGSGFKFFFNSELRAWSGFNVGFGAGMGLQWSKQNTKIYKP